MRKIVAVVLIIVGALLLGNKLTNGDFIGSESRSINDKKIVSITDVRNVNVQSGSINSKTVRGTSEEAVVRLTGNSAGNVQLTTEIKGDTLYIEAKHKDKLNWFAFREQMELVVELPEHEWKSIDIGSSSGNSEIEKLTAEYVSIEASSGNIHVENLFAGSAEIELSSGNIKVEGFEVGELKTKASSGKITIADGTGAIEAKSSSGNIILDLDRITDSIELRASSGNVTLETSEVPTGADIQIRTSSGSQRINWPGIEMRGNNDKVFTGQIGDGGIKIDLKTSSGNVTLQQ